MHNTSPKASNTRALNMSRRTYHQHFIQLYDWTRTSDECFNLCCLPTVFQNFWKCYMEMITFYI